MKITEDKKIDLYEEMEISENKGIFRFYKNLNKAIYYILGKNSVILTDADYDYEDFNDIFEIIEVQNCDLFTELEIVLESDVDFVVYLYQIGDEPFNMDIYYDISIRELEVDDYEKCFDYIKNNSCFKRTVYGSKY